MKMYKEMLRKTAVVGIPLLAITMVYTLITGGQACFGQYYALESTSAIALVPILRYYVFTAVIFALYGFSFQFSRAGSDVYHSLPVKRTDLYFSVLLATATWMGATILINTLEMLAMLLISGCPFVPVYFPLSILFYFIASMLVFMAAAIGCALSGTVITALASTGIILFLPRFVQFIFARGIVEKVPIVGWLDLGALLDPTTNIATGIVAIHLRPVFMSRIITLPHILYSILPMLAMLLIGLWLFKRRPSEIAHRNNGNKVWSVIMAIMLGFVVMLPITMERNGLLSVYGAVLVAAALGVFFLYQLIVSQSLKHVLKTLPFFILSVSMVLGLSLLIDTAADSMLNTTPAASEIESVTFRGYDEDSGVPSYPTILTRTVEFTDSETKQYVAQTLQKAVERLQAVPERYYYEYNPYKVIEPITIKLTNGKTVKRTIEFMNIDELNDLRMRNEKFAQGVRQFPPIGSVQYLNVDSNFTPEQNQAILESYITESVEKGLLTGYYYRKRTIDLRPDGSYVTQGENQMISGIAITGFVESQRYRESYSLRLETPKTVSLVMRTYNSYADEKLLTELQEVIKRFESRLFAQDDSLSVNIATYNYPDEDELFVQEQTGFYINRYTMESEYPYDLMQQEYMKLFINLLSRTSITDDPSGVFVSLSWFYYDSAKQDEYTDEERLMVFLRFENELDEQEFLELMNTWDAALRTM